MFDVRVKFKLLSVLWGLTFPGVKYSQQILCDTVSSARGSGGDRVGRLVVSPIQLEPSHTLLETQNPKLVRACVIVVLVYIQVYLYRLLPL